MCARRCSNAKQNVSEQYRFPVGKNGLVDEFQTRTGQEIDDPSYGFKSPLQGLLEREYNLALHPPKVKVVEVKPPIVKKKPGEKKAPAKKKKVLDIEKYPAPEHPVEKVEKPLPSDV